MDQVVNMSAFVQVVNVGSFTRAAKRLDISPASVTSRIQSLEQQLGIRLLNRTTRRVSLTEEGETFYQRCSRILTELAEVENLASTLQSKPSGTLRLNIDIGLARLVAPLVGEYAALYPEVSCELIMTETIANLVEEKFDLAIFTGALPDSALISRRLGAGRLVLCAAPAYLADHPPPQHPRDLAQHNCLDLVNGGAGNHWRFIGSDGEQVVNVAGNLRSNSIDALRAGAVVGHGICLLPLSSVADDVERGSLVPLLPDYEAATAVIQAVYPPGPHLSTRVRTFIDFLIMRLRGGPAADQKERKEGGKAARPRDHGLRAQSPAAPEIDSGAIRALVTLTAGRQESMRMTG